MPLEQVITLKFHFIQILKFVIFSWYNPQMTLPLALFVVFFLLLEVASQICSFKSRHIIVGSKIYRLIKRSSLLF